MRNLKLDRPLAVFDIEATGANPRVDRIIEICIARMEPAGTRDVRTYRVNPQMHIPREVVRIHGITDQDVADCPTFAQRAEQIQGLLADCDLGGFNLIRYDIPMLVEEFVRIGGVFDLTGRRVFDAQRVYHKREPRDLRAALAFYCGESEFDAHSAEQDVLATIKVLDAQLERYADLPRDMQQLDEYCSLREPNWADLMGRLKWVDGEIVLNFGKKQGTPLRELVANEPGYLKWLLRSDFPSDTKQIVRDAAEGIYPAPPE